jgi:hypothetical protein
MSITALGAQGWELTELSLPCKERLPLPQHLSLVSHGRGFQFYDSIPEALGFI